MSEESYGRARRMPVSSANRIKRAGEKSNLEHLHSPSTNRNTNHTITLNHQP